MAVMYPLRVVRFDHRSSPNTRWTEMTISFSVVWYRVADHPVPSASRHHLHLGRLYHCGSSIRCLQETLWNSSKRPSICSYVHLQNGFPTVFSCFTRPHGLTRLLLIIDSVTSNRNTIHKAFVIDWKEAITNCKHKLSGIFLTMVSLTLESRLLAYLRRFLSAN